MAEPVDDFLALADWRRRIFALYELVRRRSPDEPEETWNLWRRERDQLFAEHAQSPLTSEQRRDFNGLPYFGYRHAYRVEGRLQTAAGAELTIDLPEGPLVLRPLAEVHFSLGDQSGVLSLYWLNAYGGGLFLPFTDATCGASSYGGGRYLYDSIKGADLGSDGGRLWLDFNYAYNPSCAYNSRWICPLAPSSNRLHFPVEAGEQILPPDLVQGGTRP